jgi:hypothetical protein
MISLVRIRIRKKGRINKILRLICNRTNFRKDKMQVVINSSVKIVSIKVKWFKMKVKFNNKQLYLALSKEEWFISKRKMTLFKLLNY